MIVTLFILEMHNCYLHIVLVAVYTSVAYQFTNYGLSKTSILVTILKVQDLPQFKCKFFDFQYSCKKFKHKLR